MTSLALFDLAVSSPPVAADVRLAERLVAAELSDLQFIRQLEDSLYATPHLADDRSATLVLRSMFEEWAHSADAALERVTRVERNGAKVAGLRELVDEHGRVMAMLSVTTEDMELARAQVERGEVISMAVLRDELRTRLQR